MDASKNPLQSFVAISQSCCGCNVALSLTCKPTTKRCLSHSRAGGVSSEAPSPLSAICALTAVIFWRCPVPCCRLLVGSLWSRPWTSATPACQPSCALWMHAAGLLSALSPTARIGHRALCGACWRRVARSTSLQGCLSAGAMGVCMAVQGAGVECWACCGCRSRQSCLARWWQHLRRQRRVTTATSSPRFSQAGWQAAPAPASYASDQHSGVRGRYMISLSCLRRMCVCGFDWCSCCRF